MTALTGSTSSCLARLTANSGRTGLARCIFSYKTIESIMYGMLHIICMLHTHQNNGTTWKIYNTSNITCSCWIAFILYCSQYFWQGLGRALWPTWQRRCWLGQCSRVNGQSLALEGTPGCGDWEHFEQENASCVLAPGSHWQTSEKHTFSSNSSLLQDFWKGSSIDSWRENWSSTVSVCSVMVSLSTPMSMLIWSR